MLPTECNVEKVMDYDTLYRDFKWEIPEYYNFAFDVVDKWAQDRTKLALVSIHPDTEKSSYHTFFDLKRLSEAEIAVLTRHAGGLAESRIRRYAPELM